MAAKNAPALLTVESLDALVDLAATLDAHGVHDISLSTQGPSIGLKRPQFLAMSALLGVTPLVEPMNMPSVFSAQFGHKGARFHSWVETADLPSLGYHLVDGRPVPSDKTA